MTTTGWLDGLREFFWNDPLMAAAVAAAMVALATTPIAFAVLGRIDWFKARRGRVMQRPEFASIVAADGAGHGHPGDLHRPGGQEPLVRQEPVRVRPQQDVVRARTGRGYQDRGRGRQGGHGRDGTARHGAEEPRQQRQEARRGDARPPGRRGDVAGRGADDPQRPRTAGRGPQERRGRRARSNCKTSPRRRPRSPRPQGPSAPNVVTAVRPPRRPSPPAAARRARRGCRRPWPTPRSPPSPSRKRRSPRCSR